MTTEPIEQAEAQESGDAALETSNYEVIRKRLVDQGRELAKRAESLNQKRQDFFGTISMEVVGNQTITTENNCIPQDIINLGDCLLFGYNVHRKMSQTQIPDVFSLHRFSKEGEELSLRHVPQDTGENFLSQPQFMEDFDKLYFSFKDAFLRQLRRTEGRLLAIFQTGSKLEDIRVLRWAVDAHDNVTYIDNAGEKDNVQARSHDFAWVATRREDMITGRHPHIAIKNKVFVETVGGDLTIKVEDNTEDGVGVYSEPVEDQNQALGDAEIFYAEVGALILLKIRPYREDNWRYLVFNTLTKTAARIDSIGQSCVALPEDHGIIFPGGYVLESGEVKTFEHDTRDMRIAETRRSPNGEDVLFAFTRPQDGQYLLLSYNLIRKEVLNPILCHGYSIFDDGTMIIFRSTGDQQTRHHPMQVWGTPFLSDEYAAQIPSDGSLLSKIGNAELVRGISDGLTIRKMINNQEPTTEIYTSIISAAERMIDAYYWIGESEAGDMRAPLREVVKTATLIIEEFEKVRAMRQNAREALREAEREQSRLFGDIRYANWREIGRFVDGLDGLRSQRGRLITLREMKYMQVERIDELEQEVIDHYDKLSKATVSFLLGEGSLSTYRAKIDAVIKGIEEIQTTVEATKIKEELDTIGEGLNLLTEVISGLKIEDPTARTQILENIAEVLGQQNRARAMLDAKNRALLETEGRAEFAVQFQLLGQSVTSAISMAETPERCDEQLERMMVQLQEMESRFSEFDMFLAQLTEKREEIYEVFETRKQQLIEARQRKASTINQAAEKILAGIQRRARKMEDVEALNAYFAADAMVIKIREMATQLRELKEPVKADDLENQLKATRDQSIRTLRDKLDLFEGGDAVIKLGKHRFSINTQSLELTMVPRDNEVRLHITGTDFYEQVEDKEFLETRYLWDQQLISETRDVYRGEYLAACILEDARTKAKGYTIPDLFDLSVKDDELLLVVRKYIEERYDEGYERGVHDTDTTQILTALLGLYITAGLLRFGSKARALATLYWATEPEELEVEKTSAMTLEQRRKAKESPAQRRRKLLVRRAQSFGRLRKTFSSASAVAELRAEVARELGGFCEEHGLDDIFSGRVRVEAADYLIEELAAGEHPHFILNSEAEQLARKFFDHLDLSNSRKDFEDDLETLTGELEASWELASSWLAAYTEQRREDETPVGYLMDETIAYLITSGQIEREISSAKTETQVKELLGQHPRIVSQVLTIRLDEFLSRLDRYIHERAPEYRAYRKLSHTVLDRVRKRLRLDELKPRVLSTFVRNRLIDEVYLPLIGDNLAKQMGSVGESGRSDRQGLLLLISPPGYGKTTLMEYVANRLGLTFMKINGPAIGHHVVSLDPSEAPNATARQEVEKINLSLRMGNNVMLYLDDIQHCNPELLQKFISLCDATRRIEGVWDGQTKTYDLRGKRFSVVMAGNPYTETGERFQIPDMLANRADTYNLGDILEGSQDAFALSYIENALTSNPVLAPLSNREKEDIHLFIRMAQGEDIALTDMKYSYSAVEANEIVTVLKKLFVCQDVLLQVNQAYIESASQDDAYRTEPPFKLQGSYRNMTKLAEKVVSAMNDQELEALIDDHYLGESQTLTTEAEQNLLKLKEIRGRLTAEEKERWESIKKEYRRRKMMGGGDNDPVSRVAGPISSLVQRVEELQGVFQGNSQLNTPLEGIRDAITTAVAQLQTEGVASKSNEGQQNTGLSPQVIEQLTAAIAAMGASNSNNGKHSDQVEALLQRQTLMFEGAFGAIEKLADAQANSNRQSADTLRSIEKLMQSAPVALKTPPPGSFGGAPVAGQGHTMPASSSGDGGGGFGDRPLTGVKKRLPFKEARKQTAEHEAISRDDPPTEDEASSAPANTSSPQEAPLTNEANPARAQEPNEAQGGKKKGKVRLEPPFDTED
ncbi:MAG: DNA repair ATPase [Myxococcota bacterium]|nr:DNA repair ATPase [Myxococcota bacterium]